ncbi:MAG: hypothetical protein M0T70_02480 [Geobacteraceae bacterium]|nr:hypothetical protein [Geobacteraceae bacterium]
MVQLRGEKLQAVIKEGLIKLATECGTRRYVYNASELSKEIGVSRPTLQKHEVYIDSVLKEISAERKLTKGSALIDILRAKVDRLSDEKEKLVNELDVLRRNHSKIYESLYYRSIDLAPLVKKIVRVESKTTGRCILCNQPIDTSNLPEPGAKVLPIAKAKKVPVKRLGEGEDQ